MESTLRFAPCDSCGSLGGLIFYERSGVPVHSVLIVPTREEALGYPTGDIRLRCCDVCGLITNIAFDPEQMTYRSGYEATQAYSPTYTTFAREQALSLMERHELRGKTILEIGCGNGEFLTLLCTLGQNRGIGFDPSCDESRVDPHAGLGVTVIKDYYSDAYADYRADLVCCRMTLEHIQHPSALLRTVRHAAVSGRDAVVVIQVPNVMRILREGAFWDVYYEHCTYFSRGSLLQLLRRCGFEPIRAEAEFGDQYLTAEARPGDGTAVPPLSGENDLEALTQAARSFGVMTEAAADSWRHRLKDLAVHEARVVLWGSGSKGVAFLTLLDRESHVQYVVDINPYRHRTYMPCTGQEIIPPESLRTWRPDVVIVMNPVYRDEIRTDLERIGLTPEILTV